MNKQQTGFTLIEMVIVIILLGILAAVAVPRLSDVSSSARGGVQQGTLGALKSAWAIAYAVARTEPTPLQVVNQMVDPTCAYAAPNITCTGVTQRVDGTATALFPVTLSGAVIATPAGIGTPVL